MRRGALRRARLGRHGSVTLAGLVVVGALALAAALAPWIVPGSPTEIVQRSARCAARPWPSPSAWTISAAAC